ncbi:MAG: 4-hydroxy-tetrahydrodipicolinate reductase [Bacteroidota bacterium]
MRIGLIGYGKMGKAVEQTAAKRGHDEVILKHSAISTLDNGLLGSCDVVIEFTRPDAAVINLMSCLEKGVPVVTGTTGWQQEFDAVRDSFIKDNGALFTASNFSVGMNLVFEMNQLLAKWLSRGHSYTPSINEVHHLQKIDKPSGTAVTLAKDIIYNNEVIRDFELSDDLKITKENALPIKSIREEGVIGIHEVAWTSEIDKISLRHEAFSRDGFAMGAVDAAEWIINKKGVFGMNDMLFEKNK